MEYIHPWISLNKHCWMITKKLLGPARCPSRQRHLQPGSTTWTQCHMVEVENCHPKFILRPLLLEHPLTVSECMWQGDTVDSVALQSFIARSPQHLFMSYSVSLSFCVWGCFTCMYVCYICAEAWNRSWRRSWAATWVLGAGPGRSSGKAASTLLTVLSFQIALPWLQQTAVWRRVQTLPVSMWRKLGLTSFLNENLDFSLGTKILWAPQ